MHRHLHRAAAAAAFATALALLAPQARAENRYGEPSFPKGAQGIEGTVRYEAIRQAAYTNAQLFGAIGAYERYLKPELNAMSMGRSKGMIFLSEEAYITTGVGRAIGRCTGTASPGRCERNLALFDFDMYSGVFTMGIGPREFGFFASSSYSLTAAGGQGPSGTGGFLPVVALIALPLRIAGKTSFAKVLPGSADAVVGLYLNLGPVSASGGYILSQGAFGSVDVPKLKAFATAALTDQLGALDYLKAGFRDIQEAFEETKKGVNAAKESANFLKSIGKTSVYARNMRLSPPSIDSVGADLRDAVRQQAFSLLTANIEHKDLASLVDLSAAYAFLPGAFLQEGRVSLHTPDYNARPLYDSHKSQQDILYSAGVTAGYVSLPNLWYYGVEGGSKFSWTVELRMTYLQGIFRMFVRQNDPEFLTAFPFAYGAINGGFTFGFNGAKDR